jgi:HAD superfamily hydrolase (TIGR01509 family)
MEVAIRALVFDFDGLILDTETAEHQAWQEVYREHGTELPHALWVEGIGSDGRAFEPYDQLERQLGELIDRAAIRVRRRERLNDILSGRSILPGVAEFIERAISLDLQLGVASSSPREWVEGHLAHLLLRPHFSVVRCAEDVERVKPAPDLYLSVTDALGVRPDQTIAIEDSPNGIAAAKAAGLYCISVPNAMTRNLAMDAADLVLVSLASLSLDEVLERARRARMEDRDET